jgi:hypothetical protein
MGVNVYPGVLAKTADLEGAGVFLRELRPTEGTLGVIELLHDG